MRIWHGKWEHAQLGNAPQHSHRRSHAVYAVVTASSGVGTAPAAAAGTLALTRPLQDERLDLRKNVVAWLGHRDVQVQVAVAEVAVPHLKWCVHSSARHTSPGMNTTVTTNIGAEVAPGAKHTPDTTITPTHDDETTTAHHWSCCPHPRSRTTRTPSPLNLASRDRISATRSYI